MLTFITVGVLVVLIAIVKSFTKEVPEEESGETYDGGVDTNYRRSLMSDILTSLGCQPVKNDDGTLGVKYQGENFHIDFGGMYARVWDLGWSSVRADAPELPRLREAVNVANYDFGPTVVLSAPDEDGNIYIHSRRDIMLHPACPDNVPFVNAVLDSFFNAKNSVRSNFQQLCAQQMQTEKKRRPIGFATSEPEPETEEKPE